VTDRMALAVLGVVVACCVGKALLLAGVLAAGGALGAGPWLVAAAVVVLAVLLWRTMAAVQRQGAGW